MHSVITFTFVAFMAASAATFTVEPRSLSHLRVWHRCKPIDEETREEVWQLCRNVTASDKKDDLDCSIGELIQHESRGCKKALLESMGWEFDT